jgi:hypothetical protein
VPQRRLASGNTVGEVHRRPALRFPGPAASSSPTRAQVQRHRPRAVESPLPARTPPRPRPQSAASSAESPSRCGAPPAAVDSRRRRAAETPGPSLVPRAITSRDHLEFLILELTITPCSSTSRCVVGACVTNARTYRLLLAQGPAYVSARPGPFDSSPSPSTAPASASLANSGARQAPFHSKTIVQEARSVKEGRQRGVEQNQEQATSGAAERQHPTQKPKGPRLHARYLPPPHPPNNPTNPPPQHKTTPQQTPQHKPPHAAAEFPPNCPHHHTNQTPAQLARARTEALYFTPTPHPTHPPHKPPNQTTRTGPQR